VETPATAEAPVADESVPSPAPTEPESAPTPP